MRALLETPRLKLVPWSADYAAFVREHLNTPDVTRYNDGPMSPVMLDGFLDDLQQSQDEHGFTQWPVVRYDDVPLGLCGLMIDDSEESTYLGATAISWMFAKEYWGSGYATEAALGCMRYAFDKVGQYRVIAKVFRSNQPSVNLMQRIGMRHDHRLDYHSRFQPEPYLVHVMTWRDWRDFTESSRRLRHLLGV